MIFIQFRFRYRILIEINDSICSRVHSHVYVWQCYKEFNSITSPFKLIRRIHSNNKWIATYYIQVDDVVMYIVAIIIEIEFQESNSKCNKISFTFDMFWTYFPKIVFTLRFFHELIQFLLQHKFRTKKNIIPQ